MKRYKCILLIIAVLTWLLLFVSCTGEFGILPKYEEPIKKVFAAVEAKDEETLKSLFSENTVAADPEFDTKVHELIEFIDGALVSYNEDDSIAGRGEEREKNEDGYSIMYIYSYDVETTQQSYRIAITEYVTDTIDPGNLGISSFYIIKSEDDPNYPQYRYGGDGSQEPGIHFNVYYVNS